MVMLHSSTTDKRTIKMFAQIQKVINAVLMCQIFCGDLRSPELSSLGHEGSREVQHENTSLGQDWYGAARKGRLPLDQNILWHLLSPMQANFFLCIEQSMEWQLLLQIELCVPKKAVFSRLCISPQEATCWGRWLSSELLRSEKAFSVFFCLLLPLLLAETCWTCKQGEEQQYVGEVSWKSGNVLVGIFKNKL